MYRAPGSPTDCFRLEMRLASGLDMERVMQTLVTGEGQGEWDPDTDASASYLIDSYGAGAVLEKHVTRPVGPVSGRLWIQLRVRVGPGSVLFAGVPEPDPDNCGLPRATALPQLVVVEALPNGELRVEQSVQFQLGGWLPMSLVLSQLPELLVRSALRWAAWTERSCRPDPADDWNGLEPEEG